MRSSAVRIDGLGDSYLSGETFVDELAAALASLVPEVRLTGGEGAVRFTRGAANAELWWYRETVATVVLRIGCERVLGGGVPATPDGLNELAADLVGFFCGAPLTTLALFPRPEGERKPVVRPRRRGPYDAPLIPLPFDPQIARDEPA